MKKTIITIFALLLVLQVPAKSVREMWLSMPDSLMSYVNNDMRKELLSFMDLGVKGGVKNLLSDTTTIDTITNDYLRLEANASTTVEMKLLPLQSGDSLLLVVRTFGGVDGESEAAFYDDNWNKLPSNNMFGDYDVDDMKCQLLQKPDSVSNEEFASLKSKFDPLLMKMSISPSSDELTLTLATPLMSDEEKQAVKPIIKQKKLKWNGKYFI